MAQTKSLPPRPNLEYLKKQAKELLKKLGASNRAAKLADAQLAIARKYGYASWRKLKEFVETTRAASLDLDAVAHRAVRAMDRAWAESCAIIERRFDMSGPASHWEATGLESPTLREREADDHILKKNVMGQYRMISIWQNVKVEVSQRSVWCEPIKPRRAFEFLRPGEKGPREGLWRRIDWKPTNQGFSGKPARWDDLTEALTYLRAEAPAGEYRIITIRRMLFAQQLKDRIKIDKKHAGLTTLERIEQSVSLGK